MARSAAAGLKINAALDDPRPRRAATRTTAVFAGAGKDAGFYELRREGGEVRVRERFHRNRPDRPLIAPRYCGHLCQSGLRPHVKIAVLVCGLVLMGGIAGRVAHGNLADRFGVIEVRATSGKQKQVLMTLRGPVGDAFGKRIRFVPDDVGAQPPAVRAQSAGQHPRNADKVFWFKSRVRKGAWRAEVLKAIIGRIGNSAAVHDLALRSMSTVLPAVVAPASEVSVTEIEPAGPVAAQHATHFTEDRNQLEDIFLRRGLEADLPIDTVVA